MQIEIREVLEETAEAPRGVTGEFSHFASVALSQYGWLDSHGDLLHESLGTSFHNANSSVHLLERLLRLVFRPRAVSRPAQ